MRINLTKGFFDTLGEQEFLFASSDYMKVYAFKYSQGVEALKVDNENGYFIILPFQGQQIWRANFLGRELTMKTNCHKPVPTKVYLETYGGFLLHCGINAFGVPSKDDDHPQHGETPNADYDNAYIDITDDYVEVGGELNYDKHFVKSYTFSPKCRLYKDDTVLKIDVTIQNRRHTTMEYMYLCHINFRPEEGAELIYSGDYKNVKVFKSVSDDLDDEHKKKLLNYMNEVEKNPEIHHKIGAENQIYNPEICFSVKYRGDENNRAYTLQYAKNGADYVSHPVDVLPYAIRWISISEDERSMGMVLPATAEHLGYKHAKENGMIKILPPLSSVNFQIEAGYLKKSRADEIKEKISKI